MNTLVDVCNWLVTVTANLHGKIDDTTFSITVGGSQYLIGTEFSGAAQYAIVEYAVREFAQQIKQPFDLHQTADGDFVASMFGLSRKHYMCSGQYAALALANALHVCIETEATL
jgi:hypothetical protein